MLILFFFLAILPSSTLARSTLPAKPPITAKKGQLLEQLRNTCVKNSSEEGRSQEAVCGCLKANYEKKLSEEDLALLARIQNGSVAKADLEGKDELLEFDMEASQQCVEDSAWRWAPAAKPKEETPEAKTENKLPAKMEEKAATPAAAPKKAPAKNTKN